MSRKLRRKDSLAAAPWEHAAAFEAATFEADAFLSTYVRQTLEEAVQQDAFSALASLELSLQRHELGRVVL